MCEVVCGTLVIALASYTLSGDILGVVRKRLFTCRWCYFDSDGHGLLVSAHSSLTIYYN